LDKTNAQVTKLDTDLTQSVANIDVRIRNVTADITRHSEELNETNAKVRNLDADLTKSVRNIAEDIRGSLSKETFNGVFKRY
jgi:predicted  nucleic acid-binding Zn-ribbon protein